jgi:heat shock protein HslJ
MKRTRLWQYTVPFLYLSMAMTSCAPAGSPGNAGQTSGSTSAAPASKSSAASEGACQFLPSAPCGKYASVSGATNGKDLPWAASGGVKAQLESAGGSLQLSVQDKCGPFSGPVTIAGTTMTVGKLATGAVGCEGDLNAQHMWLFEFLKRPMDMAFSQDILTWKSGPDTLSFKKEYRSPVYITLKVVSLSVISYARITFRVNTSIGGTMKFVSCAIRVSAVLLLASAGLGGTAAVAVPGIEDAGYVEQVNFASKLATKILWKGPSPLRDTVLAEAKTRGITATMSERPYSLPEIRAAINKLDSQQGAFAALGFEVDQIVGVRDDDGAIAVEGHGVDGKKPDIERVKAAAKQAATANVRVAEKPKTAPAVATRSNDYAPFNAGGYKRRVGGGTCSTGFSLADASRTYTITPRHCPQGSYYARDNSGTYVGYQMRDSPDGQASLGLVE